MTEINRTVKWPKFILCLLEFSKLKCFFYRTEFFFQNPNYVSFRNLERNIQNHFFHISIRRNLITHQFVQDPKQEKSFIHAKYNQIIKIEKMFEHNVGYIIYLGNKMVNTGYQLEIGEFINLININGYYDKVKLATPPKNK